MILRADGGSGKLSLSPGLPFEGLGTGLKVVDLTARLGWFSCREKLPGKER